MKKIAIWLAVITFIIFVIDWGIIGLKILDGDYDITVGVYIGFISIVVCFISIFYVKSQNRCPYCGKMKQSFGKYCPYCGKEINSTGDYLK